MAHTWALMEQSCLRIGSAGTPGQGFCLPGSLLSLCLLPCQDQACTRSTVSCGLPVCFWPLDLSVHIVPSVLRSFGWRSAHDHWPIQLCAGREDFLFCLCLRHVSEVFSFTITTDTCQYSHRAAPHGADQRVAVFSSKPPCLLSVVCDQLIYLVNQGLP